MRQSRPGLCGLIGPHEVRSCSICKWKLDPKKVMGTGGVVVTFNKVLEVLWPGLAWPALSAAATYGSISLKEQELQAVCVLLKRKPFCLTRFWSVFTLCYSYSFHFHPAPLCIIRPIMHLDGTAAQMFEEGAKATFGLKKWDKLKCKSWQSTPPPNTAERTQVALFIDPGGIVTPLQPTWQSSWGRVVSSGTAISRLLNAECERGGDVSACGPSQSRTRCWEVHTGSQVTEQFV